MEKGKARIEGGKHMIRRKGAAESDQSDSMLLSRLHCFSLVIISPRGLFVEC